MKKNHKRISAAVLSLALGFSVAGAPALAPMAAAQIEAGDISTIDSAALGDLTIEKYSGFNIAGPGEYQDPVNLPGLAAEFTVQQVEGIDLTRQHGWAQVNALIAAVEDGTPPVDAVTGTPGLSLINDVIGTTADRGDGVFTTTFEDLPVGVYLVTETNVPAGHQGAAPFFVTLPYANADGTGWEYDRTVQPKNQRDNPVVKTVDDELAGVGTVSTYTIEMQIPNDANLESIRVLDDLPAELGELDNIAAYHTAAVDGNEIAFDASASDDDTLDLTIDNSAALDQLRGGTLVVTFDAEIMFAPTPDITNPDAEGGVIENSAIIELNIDGDIVTYETDPDDPTETRLGQLTIRKIDVEGNEIVGTGTQEEIAAATAEFELWRCTEQGGNWTLGDNPFMLEGDAEAVTFETDPNNGTVIIEDIQMANFVNGEETNITEDTLCVVETKAPAGYVLNPEPQPVTQVDDENFTMVVDVTNLADDGTGQLPSTGGQGTMAMIAGGLLVAVAGGFAALRGNRARG